MFTKILSQTAAAFLIPITVHAFGLELLIDGKATVLADVPQSAWYANYIRSSVELGIVTGYKDAQGNLTGRFGPGNRITLAEALKIAVEGAGYDEQGYSTRIASGVDHWSASYVSVAKGEDFSVFHDSSARILLNRSATRAEVAALFVSAFRASVANVSSGERYSDVDLRTKYDVAIEALSRDGIITGDTDAHGQLTGTFRPNDAINRAEVTKMVVLARAEYGTPGEGRVPDMGDNSNDAETHVISYSSAGFSTNVLRIKKGTSVTFRNDSTSVLWVASDPHPEHSILSNFDALRGYVQGEAYVYTFNRLGSFSFHNHLRTMHHGTIIVEE